MKKYLILLFISLAFIILPAITIAIFPIKAKAESFALIPGEIFKVDVSSDQKNGDVYFMGWHQGYVITYHDEWFAFGLSPVDVPVIEIRVAENVPSGFYPFVQFTVPHLADPHDLNQWSGVKTYSVIIQHCSGFGPPIRGCGSYYQ